MIKFFRVGDHIVHIDEIAAFENLLSDTYVPTIIYKSGEGRGYTNLNLAERQRIADILLNYDDTQP
jgi:hypothetical protein